MAKKTPDQRTEKIVKKFKEILTLTDEQAPKVKEVILKREKQHDADHKKYTKDSDASKAAKKERNKIAHNELKNILSADQFDALKKWRKEQVAIQKSKKPLDITPEEKETNEYIVNELPEEQRKEPKKASTKEQNKK
ncbi:MAG: hypothetical protein HY958_00100 [Bacteroidia bacterium]|nr:hypothetical protein [Bacteroidia bacterium]